ncbi:MAG: hypothetical protein ACT6RD_11100 [Brevundimonas sp.]|uniref:hypothetical protein n=1 Tax=Brevundimonas sp. TaxID=1871086 RepID=UPI004034EC08
MIVLTAGSGRLCALMEAELPPTPLCASGGGSKDSHSSDRKPPPSAERVAGCQRSPPDE